MKNGDYSLLRDVERNVDARIDQAGLLGFARGAGDRMFATLAAVKEGGPVGRIEIDLALGLWTEFLRRAEASAGRAGREASAEAAA